MAIHQINLENFLLYAYLPFVELNHETRIELGPVVFWPASQSEEVLHQNKFFSTFQDYLQQVRQIKTHSNEIPGTFINTIPLIAKRMTCVSISEKIPVAMREFLLIDSIYLLYFACTFRNLYYGHEIPPFSSFRKMIPASEEFVNEKKNWENRHINEEDREDTVCLHLIDSEICQALGKTLEAIYLPSENQNSELVQTYKRIVRSIRYLVDRFFSRFVNLFEMGLKFSEEIFEPEDVIFLASSFETLFNIEQNQDPAAEIKHQLRPLLHLKYSKPVEFFWKWVDDFYEVKRRILKGDTFLDPLFRFNPNFEVSHILLGIKLFVYSVYYYLFKYNLLKSTYMGAFTPPDFKWIHPDEILLFFWTEPSILDKISHFLKHSEKEELKEESYEDMNLLSNLFVSLFERYFQPVEKHKGEGIIKFHPSPLSQLTKEGNFILEKIRQVHSKDPESALLKHLNPQFMNVLDKRLHPTPATQ